MDHYAGSCVSGSIFGERPARYENHVRINKNVSDAWGIPALHIEVKDGENERNMAKDAANTIEELFHAAGWDIISKTDQLLSAGIQHSRSGHVPHGRQSEDQRAEQVQPEPRHQESVRGGRLQLRDLRLAESDDDDSGALDARIGASRRSDEEAQYRLTAIRAGRHYSSANNGRTIRRLPGGIPWRGS